MRPLVEHGRWVIGALAAVAIAALLTLLIMGGFEQPERSMAGEMHAEVAPAAGEPFYGSEGDTGGWLMDRVADATRAHPEWHVWPQPDQYYSDRTVPGYLVHDDTTTWHTYAFADDSRLVLEGSGTAERVVLSTATVKTPRMLTRTLRLYRELLLMVAIGAAAVLWVGRRRQARLAAGRPAQVTAVGTPTEAARRAPGGRGRAWALWLCLVAGGAWGLWSVRIVFGLTDLTYRGGQDVYLAPGAWGHGDPRWLLLPAWWAVHALRPLLDWVGSGSPHAITGWRMLVAAASVALGMLVLVSARWVFRDLRGRHDESSSLLGWVAVGAFWGLLSRVLLADWDYFPATSWLSAVRWLLPGYVASLLENAFYASQHWLDQMLLARLAFAVLPAQIGAAAGACIWALVRMLRKPPGQEFAADAAAAQSREEGLRQQPAASMPGQRRGPGRAQWTQVVRWALVGGLAGLLSVAILRLPLLPRDTALGLLLRLVASWMAPNAWIYELHDTVASLGVTDLIFRQSAVTWVYWLLLAVGGAVRGATVAVVLWLAVGRFSRQRPSDAAGDGSPLRDVAEHETRLQPDLHGGPRRIWHFVKTHRWAFVGGAIVLLLLAQPVSRVLSGRADSSAIHTSPMPAVTQDQVDALQLDMGRQEVEGILGGQGSLEPPEGVGGVGTGVDGSEVRYWGNEDGWVAVDFQDDKVASWSNPQPLP